MMTQTQISKILGCSQSAVNLTLTGKRSVSWPLAQKLSGIFPGKTIQQWKNATPTELKRAFNQLYLEKEKV